ncbi:MAG: hypothetical protein ABH879_04965 [archaeon]
MRYTTRDFVSMTQGYLVLVDGLPDDIEPQDAAAILRDADVPLIWRHDKRWSEIRLPEEVYSRDGKHMFTLREGTAEDPRRILKIEGAALEVICGYLRGQ